MEEEGPTRVVNYRAVVEALGTRAHPRLRHGEGGMGLFERIV